MANLATVPISINGYSVLPPQMEECLLNYYAEQSQTSETATLKLINQQKSVGAIRIFREVRAKVNLTAQRPMAMAAVAPLTPSPSPIEVWDESFKPAKLVISSKGSSSPSPEATTCFTNMQKTDNFCRTILGRFPVDNATKLMKAFIHCDSFQNNAFWHPLTQCVYFGEVDPDFFAPFVTNFDITSHEFGHAITQFTADLEYKDQSGALNESMSDVFAIQAKHWLNKTTADKANWLFADKLILNDNKAGALRSMQNPGSAYDHPILGKDPQPKHMRDFVVTTQDNGGVHINSGIPNYAFYLVSTSLGGNSWDKPGKIWYEALKHAQKQDDFTAFAGRTIQAAKDLKYDTATQDIVSKAWYDVGVDLRGLTTPSSATPQGTNMGFITGFAIFSVGFALGRFTK